MGGCAVKSNSALLPAGGIQPLDNQMRAACVIVATELYAESADLVAFHGPFAGTKSARPNHLIQSDDGLTSCNQALIGAVYARAGHRD